MTSIGNLIADQITLLRGYISRMRGVGPYQDHCQRWAMYIEAYEKLLIILEEAPQPGLPENVSIDNHEKRDTSPAEISP